MKIQDESKRRLIDTEVVTEATKYGLKCHARTVLDKDLTNNELTGKTIIIVSGTGRGQFRNIVSNTEDTVIIAGDWEIVPDLTSVFLIVDNGY